MEEKQTKINLSHFAFKREKKPVLGSISPKKRKHVEVEYDDETTVSKIRKEEDIQEESIGTLKDGKPFHWETALKNLREMRKNKDAPVDSIGYQKCPDENEAPEVRKAIAGCEIPAFFWGKFLRYGGIKH